MHRITATKPHNLNALLDEMLAAIPALRPVARPDGRLDAMLSLSGDGSTIEATVPDAVADADVLAVINAHTNPLPPDTSPPDFGADAQSLNDYPALRTAVDNLRTYLALASPTAAQSASALKLTIRVLLALVRRIV